MKTEKIAPFTQKRKDPAGAPMKTFKFSYAIKPYEIPREGREYHRKEKNSYEYTIENDADRAFIFLKPKTGQEEWCKNVYKYITKKILLETTVEYYQGMFEVASYFVLFYFEDSVNKKYKEIAEELDKDEILSAGSENIEHANEDMCVYIDKETYKTCSIVVTNVLQEKYIPLVEDDFALYNRYNKVFMRMMEKRNVHLEPEISGSYMNTTLSWFSRSIENLDDIYRIFGIIISCPTNMPFLMLIYYFKSIWSDKKIKEVDEDLYSNLVSLEHEFLRTESNMDSKGTSLLSMKGVVVGAAALGVVFAILAYQLSKKDK